MMAKKGISGLVVAVLLVAISLTIGGLVMGWMSGFANSRLEDSNLEGKKQDECQDRNFKIVSVVVMNNSDVNDYTKAINITLENKGEKEIKGFLFKVSTADGSLFGLQATSTNDTAYQLDKYERHKYDFDANYYDITGTNRPLEVIASRGGGNPPGKYLITQIEVVPIIDITVDVTTEQKCTDQAKIIERASMISI
jgi:hypothetical protein